MRRRTFVGSVAALAVAGAGSLQAQKTSPQLPSQLDPSTLASPPLQFDPSTLAKPSASADGGVESWPRAAFESGNVDQVLLALGIASPQPGAMVLLDAPDIAPGVQPIRLAVETALPKVTRVVLLADRLPRPLLAVLTPGASNPMRVAITVSLPRTTRVRAYVRSDAAWYAVQREVKLALDPA